MKHVEGDKTTGTKIEPEPARIFVNSLVRKKNVEEEEGGYYRVAWVVHDLPCFCHSYFNC